jgi:hypothetical protein
MSGSGNRVRSLTSGASHFFGFHDLTPWNATTDELVALRTEVPEDHVPTHRDQADVVIVNEVDGIVTPVGQTRAWNWQMGARQRWLPALGRRVVAYNAETSIGFELRIVDLDTSERRALPWPVHDLHDQRGFGLTLNFRRLFRCQPGYGYDHPSPEETLEPDADGILRVDLASGEGRMILSRGSFLRELGLHAGTGEHYFTHIQISPDGRRFAFMHRCFLPSGGLINHLATANTDGTGLRLLLDDKMSHFDWVDDQRLIVWCRRNPLVRRMKETPLLALARGLYRLSRRIRWSPVRQGIYNECFREIDLATAEVTSVGKGVLTEDGHPQVNPVFKHLWINDTYPDANNVMTLMLYDQRANRRIDVLRLPTQASIKETTWRCDLHPRWHPKGQRVSVDSAHSGRRQLVVVDVEQEVRSIAGGSGIAIP